MLRYQEFDAAECSMSSYLMARERGYPRLIAIPVFPSRFFRHSFIFINSESGIEAPKNLVGKRVGVPEYQITAAVWVRGILQHEYGVPPEKMKWFTGGAEDPGREEKLRPDLPKDIDIRWIGPERTLSSMLEQGELFGDEFWPYGLDPNRHVLDTLIQYSHEQGLTKKPTELKSLFAPNTLEEFKV